MVMRIERACDVYPFVSALLAYQQMHDPFATGFETNVHPPSSSPQPLVTAVPRTLLNLPTRAPHSQPPQPL